MGWWSCDTLGGDTPLDLLGNLESAAQISVDLYPLSHLSADKRECELVRTRLNAYLTDHDLETVVAAIAGRRAIEALLRPDTVTFLWRKDGQQITLQAGDELHAELADDAADIARIALQVIGTVAMAVGADLDDTWRKAIENAARRDRWARDPHDGHERRQKMIELYETVKLYRNGEPVVLGHTGLFRAIQSATTG